LKCIVHLSFASVDLLRLESQLGSVFVERPHQICSVGLDMAE
jgi:hypothetical protein